jgi:hypothetical protein
METRQPLTHRTSKLKAGKESQTTAWDNAIKAQSEKADEYLAKKGVDYKIGASKFNNNGEN